MNHPGYTGMDMAEHTNHFEQDIRTASGIIRSGGVIIYPTETVYGLGADAYNTKAVMKVSAIKKRSADKPISIAVSDLNMLKSAARPDAPAEKFIHKFLPGPVTVILPKKEEVPDILTGGSDLIGIRWPDHPLTLGLIKSVGSPITSTSANTAGMPAPSRLEDIEEEILPQVDYVVREGGCGYSEPSTIVDLVNRKILRRGALSDKVEAALEELE